MVVLAALLLVPPADQLRSRVAGAEAPRAGEIIPPGGVAAPAEDHGAVESVADAAAVAPHPELTGLLMQYMLVYRSPSSTVPAQALGKVYLEQTETFITEFRRLPVPAQKALWPFLEFGFRKATEGLNKSIPKIKKARSALDALAASLTNAR